MCESLFSLCCGLSHALPVCLLNAQIDFIYLPQGNATCYRDHIKWLKQQSGREKREFQIPCKTIAVIVYMEQKTAVWSV